jgi:hypothetical protein
MDDSTSHDAKSEFHRILPPLSLMVVAPLIAEVLPGATRISSIFVLPIEILVWGGGAVLIRFAVRRLNLGWLNMVCLAMALSVAEECLIQQTSLAPMVIKLKGEEYARAFGVNYVYFLWALIYESLFVVVIPIGLSELIFHRRREQSWLNAMGVAVITFLFLPACFMAWYTWTQIARVKVFHLEAYNPPASQLAIAVAAISILIALAIGPARRWFARKPDAVKPPHPLVLFLLSGILTSVLFGLLLLGFGILPSFPPYLAVAVSLTMMALIVIFVPRFQSHKTWNVWHEVGMHYGAIITNMAVFFVGFFGSTPIDFYGKVFMDLLAVVLLIWLALNLRSSQSFRTTPVSNQAM